MYCFVLQYIELLFYALNSKVHVWSRKCHLILHYKTLSYRRHTILLVTLVIYRLELSAGQASGVGNNNTRVNYSSLMTSVVSSTSVGGILRVDHAQVEDVLHTSAAIVYFVWLWWLITDLTLWFHPIRCIIGTCICQNSSKSRDVFSFINLITQFVFPCKFARTTNLVFTLSSFW